MVSTCRICGARWGPGNLEFVSHCSKCLSDLKKEYGESGPELAAAVEAAAKARADYIQRKKDHERSIQNSRWNRIRINDMPDLFVVRLYDGMDRIWMDVCSPVPRDEAQRIWGEKTENGTKYTKYEDIDYYAIYPADTVMHFSYEAEKERSESGE